MLFWAKMKLVAAVTAAVVVAGGVVGTGLSVKASSTPPPSMTGKITQVGDGSVTIQKGDGSTATATINDATVVKADGKVVKAGDLKVGMAAIVFAQAGQPATEIRAYTPKPPPTQPTPPLLAGKITQVGDGSITIQKTDGNTGTATYNDATVVKVNGTVAKASDLQVGMNAYVLGTAGQPVTEIRAYMPKPPPTQPASISGKITKVGDGSITVQKSDGSTATATYNDSTVVKVNTKAAKAADLQVGMNAIVIAQAGQPATEIRAYTPKP